MKILITGGAGFIGANFVRWLFERGGRSYEIEQATVLDNLTYAGNIQNLKGLEEYDNFNFVKGDICDAEFVAKILDGAAFDAVLNFAAESHVDRSIVDPLAFVRTNVEGTQVLLNAARAAGVSRFLQVSTDEVYGSLGETGRFTEESPIRPSSAYSASKAAGDMLALAAHTTHGFDVVVTRCSNNYGPLQFPEKFIPLVITNAMNDEPLPLYGDGRNVRSWLHVDDHARALMLVLKRGRPGEVYNIGGAPEAEKENIFVLKEILSLLGKPESLIRYVEDRLGHDRRYAVDFTKINKELQWEPEITFAEGIKETVDWYRDNESWWADVKSGAYQEFYSTYYGTRLQQGA